MCWMSSKWAKWYDPNSDHQYAYACNISDSYGWIRRKWLTAAAVVPHESKSICLHVKFSAMKLNLMIDKQWEWAWKWEMLTLYSVYTVHCTFTYLYTARARLLVSILMLKFNIPCTGYVRIFLRFIQKFHLLGAPVTTFIHTY